MSKTETTKSHELYNLALYDHDMLPVIAYGSAGTGKTYGAVQAAMEGMWSKKYRKIIVTRPNVSFADTLGHLPGTDREKMEPWVAPVLQHMKEMGMKAGTLEMWEKDEKLIFKPLEHIQGLTFDNSIVIVDECQNMSFDQLRVFLTRVGKWSKVVLCGDIAQTSPKFKNSGLAQLIKMIDKFDLPVHTIQFDTEDIVRSEQCKMWVKAFEAWEAGADFSTKTRNEYDYYEDDDVIETNDDIWDDYLETR